MSASLVGSEMCIRDRPLPPDFDLEKFLGGSVQVAFDMEPSEIQETVAVSYTHLTLPTICSV
eukprot:605579-Alexandrium_andersonii.AAC.1